MFADVNPVVNFFGSAALVLFLSVFAWSIWKTWQAGARQAEEQQHDDWAEEGRCGKCGYDMRGTPGRCPECGYEPDADDQDGPRDGELDPRALRDDWPTTPLKPRVPVPGESPLIVYASRNAFEVDLLAQQLEARGVLCSVDRRSASVLSGAVVHNVVEHCVACASGDEERALEIVELFRARPKAAAHKTELDP